MATIIERGPCQYQVKVRRHGQPVISKTFTTRADAVIWARSIESEMDKGVFTDRREAEKNTLGNILARYRDEISPENKGHDVEKIRLNALIRDPIGNIKMSELSNKKLAEWRDRRLKVDQVLGSTVNRELNMISAAINVARKEWGIHVDNPVKDIRRPTNEPARERRLSPQEEKKLFKHLEQTERDEHGRLTSGMRNNYIKPIVELALETAMRRSEMFSTFDKRGRKTGLWWENINLKKRVARVVDTKNGDIYRDVPLSTRAIAVLKTLPKSEDGQVFNTTISALKKAFSRACQRAGILNFHFHDLRHEATSRLAKRLPNLIELAAVTGHKDLRMLKRYYHPLVEDLARKLG